MRFAILTILLTAACVSNALALPNGAPGGHTGVDGESTCLSCHRGISLNSGGGNVVVTFPGSFTYTPGVRQRLRITVNDTAGGGAGYQATARRADSPQVPAGSFSVPAAAAGGPGFGFGGPGAAGPARSRVTCWNGDLEQDDSPKPAGGCPASAPIESVTHAVDIPASANGSASWEFDFIPPATNVGTIRIYAAGNIVLGPAERNSRVYTSYFDLTPADPVKPEISAVTLDSPYGAGTKFSPGTWVAINGSALAATLRNMSDVDFNNGVAPTSMDSVEVRVGGKPAFLSSVNGGMVRAQIPAEVPPGSTALVVNVGQMSSAESKIEIVAVSPYLAVRQMGGKSYAAASFAGGGFVAPPRQGGPGGPPPGGGGGFQARQAGAGDELLVDGIGVGATTPAVPIGSRAPAGATVAGVTVRLGDKEAAVTSAALVPGSVGIYRIGFTVPEGLPVGEVPLVIAVNGVASTQQLLLPTR